MAKEETKNYVRSKIYTNGNHEVSAQNTVEALDKMIDDSDNVEQQVATLGSKVGELQEQINEINGAESLNVEESTSYISRGGAETPWTGFIEKTDFVATNQYVKFVVSGTYYGVSAIIITYDANQQFKRSYLHNEQDISGTHAVENYEYKPLDDEVYVRFCSLKEPLKVTAYKKNEDVYADSIKIRPNEQVKENNVQEALESVRVYFSEQIKDLNERFNELEEHEVFDDFILGSYYSKNRGIISSYATAERTELIDVEGFAKFVVTGTYYGVSAIITTYDEGGVFLRAYLYNATGSSENTITNYEFVPQEDEKKIAFCSTKRDLSVVAYKKDVEVFADSVKIRPNASITEQNVQEAIISNANRIKAIENKWKDEETPLVAETATKYIAKTGSEIEYTTALVQRIDFVDTSLYDEFKVTATYYGVTCCIATYDSSKTFIRSYYYNQDVISETHTINDVAFVPLADEKFVSFCSIKNELAVVAIKRAKTEERNALYGKKYVCYGDSITAGWQLEGWNESGEAVDNDEVLVYAKLIADKNNMQFKNYGRSAHGYSGPDHRRLLDIIESSHSQADIVTIAMGTNDYGLSTKYSTRTFGEITDNTTSTFCGCVRLAFEKITQYYPEALVLIILPLPRPTDKGVANDQGKTLCDYSDAIKQIASDYGFPTLDLTRESRSNIRSNTFVNKYWLSISPIHPNLAYHKKYYAPIVERFMIDNALD